MASFTCLSAEHKYICLPGRENCADLMVENHALPNVSLPLILYFHIYTIYHLVSPNSFNPADIKL